MGNSIIQISMERFSIIVIAFIFADVFWKLLNIPFILKKKYPSLGSCRCVLHVVYPVCNMQILGFVPYPLVFPKIQKWTFLPGVDQMSPFYWSSDWEAAAPSPSSVSLIYGFTLEDVWPFRPRSHMPDLTQISSWILHQNSRQISDGNLHPVNEVATTLCTR